MQYRDADPLRAAEGERSDFHMEALVPAQIDLEVINHRIDTAIALNRRAEAIVIGMALCIFCLGLAVVGLAYWVQNPYLSTGAVLLQSLLYWPVREILRLRRENLILQTVPALIATLPRLEAAREVCKLLAYLRK